MSMRRARGKHVDPLHRTCQRANIRFLPEAVGLLTSCSQSNCQAFIGSWLSGSVIYADFSWAAVRPKPTVGDRGLWGRCTSHY